MPRGCGGDGTRDGVSLALAQTGQYTIRAIKYFMQGRCISDHGKYHVYRFRYCPRRSAPAHSCIKEPLHFRLRAIVSSNSMACIKEPLRYATAHGSQPDKSKISHDCLQL